MQRFVFSVVFLLVIFGSNVGYGDGAHNPGNPGNPGDGARVFVSSTRGNEDAALRLAEYINNKSTGNAVLLKSESFEFPNGNTFVRFGDDITGHDFILVLPKKLTPNTLMESLIKVNTAEHARANSVTVVDYEEYRSGENGKRMIYGAQEPFSISVIPLFRAAGASNYMMGTQKTLVLHKINPEVTFNKNVQSSYLYHAQHPELGTELSSLLNIPIINDLSLLKNSVQNQLLFYILSSAQPVNGNFFKTLADVQSLQSHGVQVFLVTPYLPYARSDKVDQPGVAITGRLIADLIESSGVNSVAFVRAHAPQSEGFFSIPTFHANGRQTINQHIKSLNIDVVVAPDNGAGKETALHAKELGLPMALINKARDPVTGKIKIIDVVTQVSLDGKKLIIIDDETASGSTFAEAAAFLKGKGASEIYGIVTSLTGNAARALESHDLKQIVVTNAVPVPKNLSGKVKVLSIAEELAKKIYPVRSALGYNHVYDCQGIFK